MAEIDLVSRPERRSLVSRPGKKLTFEPTIDQLHSSFSLSTTDAKRTVRKKHNSVNNSVIAFGRVTKENELVFPLKRLLSSW